ncbi:MAG: pitrilysin family protein [Pusillimonas sp.]
MSESRLESRLRNGLLTLCITGLLMGALPAIGHARDATTLPQQTALASDTAPAAEAAVAASTTTPTRATEWPLPAGVVAGPSVEGTHEFTLPNGLKVLLSPDDAKASVTVNMTYLVGARHENYGETGMAHLLEHMLFRGTPSLPNALAEFSKRGLRANGTTSEDRTNYFASFAADPDLIDWYIRWQADVMVNATISRKDLDAEMTVVRNEMEAGENNPFQTVMQKSQAVAYQWHNYGKDTIGARSDVENVDIEQLRAFYRQYYQPDNAILIVSGKFNPAHTLATIADAFKPVPRPTRQLPPEYTVEPVQEGERRVVVRRNGGTPLVVTQYHIPPAASPEFVALDLGASILTDVPSGRLYKALVDKKLAARTFGYARGMRQPGYALFGAQLETGVDPYPALDALNSVLADVAQTPFTQQELDRVKARSQTQWSQIHADPAHLAAALSEASALGDWRLFFWQRDQIEKTSLDDVQRLCVQYLVPDNRTEGLYIPTTEPQRAPLPAHAEPARLLNDYTGRAAAENVAAFDSSPAAIDTQTLRDPLVLADGTSIELALLSKPTRGNRAEARLLMQFGNADLLQGQRTAANAVASLLDQGTLKLSRQEIQDRLIALQADLSLSGGAGNVVADISAPDKHLPAVIELVAHILREPAFPAEELDTWKTQVATSISSAMAEPGTLASQVLARYDNPWPKADPRYTPTFTESLDELHALTRDDLVQFHKRFYGTGTLKFTAVGAFDPGAVRGALAQGFDQWQKAPAYRRLDNPYRAITPASFTLNTPDKANAIYVATLPLNLQDDNPDYHALYVANYLLGGSTRSRLWERIRVQEGISYGVGSNVSASAYEPSGAWGISGILAPENAERFKAALNEELNKALQDGFTQEEVQEATRALLNLRRLNRSDDDTLSAVWMNYLQEGRTFAWSARVDDTLQNMTADDVNRALRTYLKPDAFSAAFAGDFENR